MSPRYFLVRFLAYQVVYIRPAETKKFVEKLHSHIFLTLWSYCETSTIGLDENQKIPTKLGIAVQYTVQDVSREL